MARANNPTGRNQYSMAGRGLISPKGRAAIARGKAMAKGLLSTRFSVSLGPTGKKVMSTRFSINKAKVNSFKKKRLRVSFE